MLFDEGHGLAAEGISGIINFTHRHCAAQDRVVLVRGCIEVIMPPSEKSEVLIESALERVEFWFVPQVRFANPPGRITQFLETISYRFFVQRKPKTFRRALGRPRIELMPKPLLITPG